MTDTSGLFINSTYGIGTEMAASGQNGPSIFPTTSVGARVRIHPVKDFYVQGVILDGVPGSTTNPEGTHVDFGDKEGALLAGEVGFSSDTAGHFAIGAWHYTARFDDLVTAGVRDHDRGVYFLAERNLWSDVDGFARLGFANDDVNQFSHAWSAGLVWNAPCPDRKDGQLGFAVSQAVNGSKFKQANGAGTQSAETQYELTYHDMLTPWLGIQPDIQYTVNPGTDSTLSNSLAAGIRFDVTF